MHRPTLRAAVLALDGVLADLAPAREAALTEALAAEGAPVDDQRAVARAARRAADAGWDDAVRSLGLADEVAAALVAHRAERSLAARIRHGGVTYTWGAAAAVLALGARLRLALVTTLPGDDARLLLDGAGLTPLFGTVVAGDVPGGRGAPDAAWTAAVSRLAGRLPGLAPAEVAGLAGTVAGVAAARRAGLHAVRVAPPNPQAGATRDEPTPDDAPLGTPHVTLDAVAGLTPSALAAALDLPPFPAPIAR